MVSVINLKFFMKMLKTYIVNSLDKLSERKKITETFKAHISFSDNFLANLFVAMYYERCSAY